jgi:hypothetical protein
MRADSLRKIPASFPTVVAYLGIQISHKANRLPRQRSTKSNPDRSARITAQQTAPDGFVFEKKKKMRE